MDTLHQGSALTFGNLTASTLSLAIALSIPFLSTVAKTHLAGVSDLQTRGSVATGRRGRLQRRRRFKPKKNIFGGAWAAIYLIMGLASWLVWRQGGLRTQALPLSLYILQLGVNLFAWPPIFVGGQRRRYAVADSAALLGVSLMTMGRRSATDTDRRATRRTTDDFSDRFTHTDSGHLIMPQQWDKPERKNSSGLFGKMSVNLQAAAEALTDSAPGLPSPFERFSKSVNQLVGRPSLDEGPGAAPLQEEEELDMSIRSDSIDTAFFADPGGNGVKLRGPTYLEDKKKIETGDPICWLSSANLMEVAPTFHIARFLPSITQSKAPFTFALQIMVPGRTNVSLTLSWSTDYDPISTAEQPGAVKQGPKGDADSEAFAAFDRVMARFMHGDHEEDVKRRHNTFKLIPRVTKGSWVIRNAVGSTPVLLGKKLTTKYFRGPNYFEVDIDVGSSKSAASVVGLVQGALKGLVIDMAITMEGHSKDELPEALLGAVRLQNLDLGKAAVLDLETGHITRRS
ncbi:hypothetical protein WJX79_009992 [Trebouxia sp. C0005]